MQVVRATLALTTLYVAHERARVECVLRTWYDQAATLSRAITQAGMTTEVIVITNHQIEDLNTTSIPSELMETIDEARTVRRGEGAEASRHSMYWTTLCKLAIFALANEWVAFFDVDTELAPPFEDMYAAGASWVHALLALNRDRARVFTRSDGASPINAGCVLVKRTPGMYHRALKLLRETPWNDTHGWGLRGGPRIAFQPYDAAWRVNKGRLLALRENTWLGWHGGADQGFLYYMLRMLSSDGTELSLLRAPNLSYSFWHYVGQCKPFDCAFTDCSRASQHKVSDARVITNTIAYITRAIVTSTHTRCRLMWYSALSQKATCNYERVMRHLPETRPLYTSLKRYTKRYRAFVHIERAVHNETLMSRVRPEVVHLFSGDAFGGLASRPMAHARSST